MNESKTLLIAVLASLAAYLLSSSLPSSAHCGEGAEKNLRKARGVKKNKKNQLFLTLRVRTCTMHHLIHFWSQSLPSNVQCDTYQPSLFTAADLITCNMHAQASTVQQCRKLVETNPLFMNIMHNYVHSLSISE